MKAEIILDERFVVGTVDPRLYGSFVEHLGRGVYGGIYDPGHPAADENGFREDVLSLVRELGVSVVRYPGGNFVSSFDWEDSVGPANERPVRLDLAWKSKEPNTVGLNEFALWARKAGAELMMAVNLGTRGIEEARNLVEYCNHPGGSYWSDLRKRHGYPEPHGIRLWCLGNELDGPWQVGRKTAVEYGRLACETAKALRYFDGGLGLAACGSSISTLPTFPSWERQVLEQCYDAVDYLSLHMYLGNAENDTAAFLAKPAGMDRYIETVVAVCDYVKAEKRSRKTINLSFDEWNVWYHTLERDKEIMKNSPWTVGPPLLEDVYTFEDALVAAMMINSLIRHADRVKIACLAQLVNVIAPIMTETGGAAWKQATFYPFQYASRYGRGTALDVRIECPSYEDAAYGTIPFLDASAVFNPVKDELALFVVNRHLSEAAEIRCVPGGFGSFTLSLYKTMAHLDPSATNTKENADNVAVGDGTGLSFERGALSGAVPPLSWNLIVLKGRP